MYTSSEALQLVSESRDAAPAALSGARTHASAHTHAHTVGCRPSASLTHTHCWMQIFHVTHTHTHTHTHCWMQTFRFTHTHTHTHAHTVGCRPSASHKGSRRCTHRCAGWQADGVTHYSIVYNSKSVKISSLPTRRDLRLKKVLRTEQTLEQPGCGRPVGAGTAQSLRRVSGGSEQRLQYIVVGEESLRGVSRTVSVCTK